MRKDDTRKNRRRITISGSQADLEKIRHLAALTRHSVSGYCRRAALRKRIERIQPKVDSDALHLLTDLRHALDDISAYLEFIGKNHIIIKEIRRTLKILRAVAKSIIGGEPHATKASKQTGGGEQRKGEKCPESITLLHGQSGNDSSRRAYS